MLTESLEANQSDRSIQEDPSSDSSRMLLGLIALARRADGSAAGGSGGSLGGVISRDILRSLLSALQFRDVSTLRHCRRTAQLSVGMAKRLGWDESQLVRLEVAALLHDVGKIGVPDNVLFKPGKLSSDEAALMALHRNIGLDVLQACKADREVLEIIDQSHVQEEGGPIGGDVHLGARILAVADAYDALTTDQVYRSGLSHEEALQVLQEAAGARFDGNVVRALTRWIETEGTQFAQDASDVGGPAPDTAEADLLCSVFSYLYVLESLYDGFYLVDADRRFVVWSPGAERLLGYSADEVLGRAWTCGLLRHADGHGQPLVERDYPLNRSISEGRGTSQQVRIERPDGQWVEVESQSLPLLDRSGRLHGVAEIFRDLSRTRHRSSEYRELKLAASRDPLTSLVNRAELESQLAELFSDYQNCTDEPFSVIALDLDYFKQLNETYGHTVGDQVLVDVARLLQDETYSGEVIGRYGGEEFLLLCPDTDLDQAVRRAERLRTAITRTTIAGLTGQKITASFGVAQVEPEDSPETLLERGEKALCRAKESGRNRTCSFTRADIERGQTRSDELQEEAGDPFVYECNFEACIAADMIVYKLGGFVQDHRAKLKKVSPKRAVLRLGSRGLFGFWGSSDDVQPVEIEIEFGDERTAGPQSRRSAAKYVSVRVQIRPVGWIRNSQTFRDRAKRVTKLIRSYFVVG